MMPIQALLMRNAAAAATPVTWNPLDKHANITLSGSDNRIATKVTDDVSRTVRATVGRVHTDEGYFEIFSGSENGNDYLFGANFRLYGLSTTSLLVANYCGSNTSSWGFYEDDGKKYTNGVATAYGSAPPHASVVGVAFKNGKLWFAVNNTWQGGGNPAAGTGEAFSGITGTVYPTCSLYLGTVAQRHVCGIRSNAAQCTYTPPTGFSYWER